MQEERKSRPDGLFDMQHTSQGRMSSIKEEFPTLEDIMFRNKRSQRRAKRKKYYKNKK